MSHSAFLDEILNVYRAAHASDDGQRCAVAPHPDLRARMVDAIRSMRQANGFDETFVVKLAEPKAPGLNDGMIYPSDQFAVGTAPSAIRNAAADRAPLRGTLRVIVVLVDFTDKHMTQNASHFKNLFFSQGVIPTKSVREYYQEVTNGLVDIQGDVVGPFRMPQTLAAYAHGAAGLGNVLPNARTMARDAVIASNPSVNFGPFDNNGDGFVDAFIVIHAGSGGEVTGNSGDIWSHKWVLDGGARAVDTTKIFGYLTVPEDCKIGVCAHELGHLLFGFPDLYDTDGTSEGIGNWCLMAAGSWGGGGDTPCHPSAWCKANQGWVSVDNRTANGVVSIHDVKDAHTVYRLWKDGAAGNEYFLVENRQRVRFDASLPGGGLLVWHVDESQGGNTDENHYKVALMQADGKRDLEIHHSRGDAGDPYPGSSGNSSFNNTSTPNSKSYAGANTCCAVTGISASGPSMTANLQVKCVVVKPIKEIKEFKEHKEFKEIKEIEKKEHKDFKDKDIEKKEHKEFDKPILDNPGKPVIDKAGAFDKGPGDHKLGDVPGGGGGDPGRAGKAGKEFDKPLKEGKEHKDKDFKEHKEGKETSDKSFKEFKEHKDKDFKDKDKDIKDKEKDFKEHKEGKETSDKPFKDFKEHKDHKDKDGKDKEHKELETPPAPGGDRTGQMAQLEARIAVIETALRGDQGGQAAQPFIGQELRPDLSQTPFSAEDDQGDLQQQMKQGSASAKRAFDTKPNG
jgi:immune inhibitor A